MGSSFADTNFLSSQFSLSRLTSISRHGSYSRYVHVCQEPFLALSVLIHWSSMFIRMSVMCLDVICGSFASLNEILVHLYLFRLWFELTFETRQSYSWRTFVTFSFDWQTKNATTRNFLTGTAYPVIVSFTKVVVDAGSGSYSKILVSLDSLTTISIRPFLVLRRFWSVH